MNYKDKFNPAVSSTKNQVLGENKKLSTYSFIFIVFMFSTFFLFNSCVQGDDYDVPGYQFPQKWTTNKTMAELISLINPPSANNAGPVLITLPEGQEFITEGYVISSDEAGNFYKTLIIQDKLENPTTSIQIDINAQDMYTVFPVGSKIQINAKGLYWVKDAGVLKLGGVNQDGSFTALTTLQVASNLGRTTDAIGTVIPIQVSGISAINSSMINKLIKIPVAQFVEGDLGKTYAITSPTPDDTNRTLEDNNGKTVILRSSGYANFATTQLPEKKGSITAIVSIYNTTLQLYIRDLNDVQFTDERIDFNPPKGGTALVYSGNFTENFESYATGDEVFPKYINDPAVGKKYWRVASFSGNKYIQMSSYSSSSTYQDPLNKTYFIVPVDFTAAKTLSFKTKAGFYNGAVLKVYTTTTSYTPLGTIDTKLLTDITSHFSISTSSDSGYAPTYTNSGIYTLPDALTGNGYVLFEYIGGYSFTPDLTSTMQIDDIEVKN